jgi:HTH-type transcriptional regulator/antitoxin MqsA
MALNELDELLARSIERRRLPEPAMQKFLRIRAQLTQQEVALVVKTNRASVSRWESGQRTPRGEQLARYLDLLDRLAA